MLCIIVINCKTISSWISDKVGKIEQGVFIEDHDVMCYILCVYKTLQVVSKGCLDKK